MRIHNQPHPLAGQTVMVKVQGKRIGGLESGARFVVKDWWDREAGESWMMAIGNPAVLQYAIRTGFARPSIPRDDAVVYGYIDGLGYLVHVSELGPVIEPAKQKVPGERGSLC